MIATPGNLAATLAAKAATPTIPIVFSTGADPVQTDLVASFSRPGGNLTGISSMNVGLLTKRLGLLHELLPQAARIVVLINPTGRVNEMQISEVVAAASAIQRQVEIFFAGTNREIDAAFASLAQKRPDALLLGISPFFIDRRTQILTLAAHHRLPACYFDRVFAEAPGRQGHAIGPQATPLPVASREAHQRPSYVWGRASYSKAGGAHAETMTPFPCNRLRDRLPRSARRLVEGRMVGGISTEMRSSLVCLKSKAR